MPAETDTARIAAASARLARHYRECMLHGLTPADARDLHSDLRLVARLTGRSPVEIAAEVAAAAQGVASGA